MPIDATTRRLDRLEAQAKARGPQVDVSWIDGVIADVYGTEREAGKVTMRADDFRDFGRVLLKIYSE